MSETPYSAVVIPIHYSQKVTEDNNESILTIQAKVVTPLRGNLPEIINFVVITDKNESLGHLGDKILLTFCSVDEKLYFAGVGAAFTPTGDLINHVKLIVKNLDDIQIKYDFCN